MMIVALWDILLVIAGMVVLMIGYVTGNNEMLMAGAICEVIAALVLVGLMCTPSFWQLVFGVKSDR
jgi:hypothetical protein